MKVKVIKASLSSYWYADRIGQEYDVVEIQLGGHEKLEYKVVGSELVGTKYFDKDDVEIIEEEKAMKREDRVNVEITLHEAAWLYAITAKANGTVGYNVYKTLKSLVDPEGEAYDECIAGKFDLIDYKSIKREFEAAIFDRKSPEQVELDKLMSQISDLQKQAEKLQEVIAK